MTNKFEEFDIEFKIVSNKNENVYVEGYVTINDEEGEDVDWYYYDAQGFATPQMFIEHNGVDGFKGATEEQKWEVEQFRADYGEDAFWIDTAILQSNEDENRTYVRENCTLIINEGAKMECEIKEDIQYRGDFVVEVIPKFNGEFIQLAKYMSQNGVDFDPWYCEDDTTVIEKGHIYFEMSKDYWEGDAQDRVDRIKDVNDEARGIFAMYLTSELGIYSKYGEVMEQSIEMCPDDEFLFKLSQLINSSDDELDAFLRKEGYIDEELEN